MGEAIGAEYPAGDDCTKCWGIGKTFGVGDTPLKVYITWTGLAGGLAGGNKTFVGVQDSVVPCQWNFDDGVYSGKYWFTGVLTRAWIELKPGAPPGIGIAGGICDIALAGLGATCTIS